MAEFSVPAGITFVGLGSGDPDQMTRQAWSWLQETKMVAILPGVEPIAQAIEPEKILRLGQTDREPEADLVAELLDLASQPGGITYAAPGAPLEGDAVAQQVYLQAKEAQLPVREIAALSLFDLAKRVTSERDGSRIVQLDAREMLGLHVPPFPPATPAMLMGIDSVKTAAQIRQILGEVYAGDTVLHSVQPGRKEARQVSLDLLDSQEGYSPFEVWSLPALGMGTSLEEFQEIVAHLRAPNGCPWDREQTHLTLRKHLLEETYETLETLDAGDIPGMVEELGDLLLQIVLHAQIANEEGEFRLAQVIQGIYDKIIRRHPHVFAGVQVEGVQGVLQNWERLKAAEREGSSRKAKKDGFLSGVPPVFPSLAQAQEIQDRVARVNFDWKDITGVLEKVDEELEEVKNAPTLEAKTAEIGDLLFAVVNLARWEKVDAESALRETNARFRRRFAYIEAAAKEKSLSLDELGFDEMNRLWDEAKHAEAS